MRTSNLPNQRQKYTQELCRAEKQIRADINTTTDHRALKTRPNMDQKNSLVCQVFKE